MAGYLQVLESPGLAHPLHDAITVHARLQGAGGEGARGVALRVVLRTYPEKGKPGVGTPDWAPLSEEEAFDENR